MLRWEKQIDFLRLLWVEDFDPNDKSFEKKYKITTFRFTRCVFGVSPSPFHLMATIKFHTDKYMNEFPEIVAELQKSLYVDDFTSGADEVDEGYALFGGARRILKEGGFNLRKFATNSRELLAKLEADVAHKDLFSSSKGDGLTYSEVTQQSIELPKGVDEQKTLGIIWNKDIDSLVFRFDAFLEAAVDIPLTKRGLLRLTARVYDPLGLIGPILVLLKSEFQSVCKTKMSWDDALPESTMSLVKRWLRNLREVGSIEFPRYCLSYPRDTVRSVQLVGFSDASKLAYGAVVYLRCESETEIDVNLIMSKSRVAPLKVQSIPRLELLGALVLSKMRTLALDTLEIPISDVFLFSDSKTALCWIKNSQHQFKQFVEERSRTIRENSSSESWRHVKGEENPADLTTRGIMPTDFKEQEVWFKGPAWLKLPINQWPVADLDVESTDESVVEMKAADKEKLSKNVVMVSVSYDCEDVIDLKRFNDFMRLLRITAYVRRFIHNCKKPLKRRVDVLSAQEIREAQLLWVKSVQGEMVQDGKFEQISRNLMCYKDDDGVIRCKGRLEKAVDQTCRFPILLPRRHQLSKLIVIDSHAHTLHGGVHDTMSCVRQRFWIPQLRQVARQIVHKCVDCRRVDGKPYSALPMPPLPYHRVNIEYPFSTSGVDYAGPLYVKTIEANSKGEKAYILLITCTSTRAVHLELTHDLGAQSCIRALRRFIAKRGIPKLMISDNAKTFEATETKEFLRDRGIDWDFILPYAPWNGGFYERMVRSTKRCLKKVLKKNSLTYEEMQTLLMEVENTINNRPLTYIENDSTIEPLSPNHLIYGRCLPMWSHEINASDAKPDGLPNTLSCSRKRFAYRQKILHDFKKRWASEYLNLLREKQRIPQTKDLRIAKIGDVVLLGDKTPRLNWKMGKIIDLIKGKDGLARGAVVRVAGSNKVLRRAVVSIFPLEERAGESVPERSTGESPLGLVPEHSIPGGKAIERGDLDESFRLSTGGISGVHNERRERRKAALNSDLKRRLLKQI